MTIYCVFLDVPYEGYSLLDMFLKKEDAIAYAEKYVATENWWTRISETTWRGPGMTIEVVEREVK